MLVMSTQLIGFSIGGICRRFLVNPPSMSTFVSVQECRILNLVTVWPANLVTCALFNTLHAQTYAGIGHRGGISRERFFFYFFCGIRHLVSGPWLFVPSTQLLLLGMLDCTRQCPVNEMFGYIHGMGMSLITFDWAQISYIGSPLATPWWAEVNILVGFVSSSGSLPQSFTI
jgi:hypothetical protein